MRVEINLHSYSGPALTRAGRLLEQHKEKRYPKMITALAEAIKAELMLREEDEHTNESRSFEIHVTHIEVPFGGPDETVGTMKKDYLELQEWLRFVHRAILTAGDPDFLPVRKMLDDISRAVTGVYDERLAGLKELEALF